MKIEIKCLIFKDDLEDAKKCNVEIEAVFEKYNTFSIEGYKQDVKKFLDKLDIRDMTITVIDHSDEDLNK